MNILDYAGVIEKLNTIKTACADTESALSAMNTEITTAVGPSGTAWQGDSANQFLTSWNELAAAIPSFVQSVNTQATNIETALTTSQNADQGGSVE